MGEKKRDGGGLREKIKVGRVSRQWAFGDPWGHCKRKDVPSGNSVVFTGKNRDSADWLKERTKETIIEIRGGRHKEHPGGKNLIKQTGFQQ